MTYVIPLSGITRAAKVAWAATIARSASHRIRWQTEQALLANGRVSSMILNR